MLLQHPNSLADHRFKTFGLVFTLCSILLFAVLRILDLDYEDNWENGVFIMNHFLIVFGLFMMAFSSEARDDERVKHVRYILTRLSLGLVICGILAYLATTILDRVEGSLFVIVYIIEGVLILYQVLFTLCLKIDPAWIFREQAPRKRPFIVVATALVFLFGWVIFVAIRYSI
jgi:hypothetical protein